MFLIYFKKFFHLELTAKERVSLALHKMHLYLNKCEKAGHWLDREEEEEF